MTTLALALKGSGKWTSTILNYVAITKPRIILLLLATTIPAMVVAEGGWPSTALVIATLVGGTASAAGANAVNCWYDRDIDAIMQRTRSRPLVRGVIPPLNALCFGITLGIGAFAFLWATTNLLAATLAGIAFLFYIFIYTMWLKRRSSQNIVIGGAAGAFPPMVGWVAVTGELAWAPILMFAIIFFWTPPHFWALALRIADDYREAGVPMLPVEVGEALTRRQILAYSIVLVPITLTPLLTGTLGWLYGTVTALAGFGFVAIALGLWRWPQHVPSMRLYTYSLFYLATIFIVMTVDIAILG
ncbi:MAG TPA: protoheme IX farnesyltransferase [Dehalococcoidia bacterium]|nr:protoheme IX farnesyltransferase [Dehalococcoidia bacterium]